MILDIITEYKGEIITAFSMAILGFLFSKDGILFKIFASKEQKELREENHKDTAIDTLTNKVDELTKKYEASMLTIQAQTIEIHELKTEIKILMTESNRNNEILEAIKKWMSDNNQPTDFLEILQYHAQNKPIK